MNLPYDKSFTNLDNQFKTIADSAPVLIWISGLDKGCFYFNQKWLDFTGRTPEMEQGNGWAEGVHPDDFDRCIAIYHSNFDAKTPFTMEYRLRRFDGQYRWLLDNGVPRYSPEGEFTGFIGSCIDIQDQKNQNELLEQKVAERTAEISEQNHQIKQRAEFSNTVFNASIDITVAYDVNFNFLAINNTAKEVYKLDDSSIGKNILEMFPVLSGKKMHKDSLVAFSGETVHNAVYHSPVTNKYYEDYLIPIKDENNSVYAILMIARDISKRIETEIELKSLNDQLTSQNSDLQTTNDDLASFAYIASHDLQEPLRKVNMFASRILERDGKNLSEQSSEYFKRINSAIHRMQNLIQALLNYSSTSTEDLKFVKTDLNAILNEVKLNLDEAISEKNAIIESETLPSLRVIPMQMQQLFHNLISNGLKYSTPDVQPVITVTAQNVQLEDQGNRKFVKLSFTDNGIGFDPQFKHKIFELFQRLHGKTQYEGTGIGLAICRKIALIHNGFITADGEPGGGATFCVFLPVNN